MNSDESPVVAELLGTVVSIAAPGTLVPDGGELAVLEAMKMQHPVLADGPVEVARVLAEVGETVAEGSVLLTTRHRRDTLFKAADPVQYADLSEIRDRHAALLDDARAEKLAKIRSRGRRTARENLADLADPGSFVEYGPLALAAQRRRRTREELAEMSPADGLIGGTATIDGHPVVVLSYDYSVLAGTQGMVGHHKTDRLLDLAARRGWPVVLSPRAGAAGRATTTA